MKIKQCGVGLIEVMVTVLILSTSLMALAALQIKSLQYNDSAYLRSQANIIAYDVMDRIRIKTPPTKDAVALDLDFIGDVLPGGEGSVECPGRVCTVSITWDEPTTSSDGTAEKTTFIYVSQI